MSIQPLTNWLLTVNDQQLRNVPLEREHPIQVAWAAARRVIETDDARVTVGTLCGSRW
jgi:hypothetical protein